jgi:hypothetical protein
MNIQPLIAMDAWGAAHLGGDLVERCRQVVPGRNLQAIDEFLFPEKIQVRFTLLFQQC